MREVSQGEREPHLGDLKGGSEPEGIEMEAGAE